jgi:hypothetical protein
MKWAAIQSQHNCNGNVHDHKNYKSGEKDMPTPYNALRPKADLWPVNVQVFDQKDDYQ